MSQQSLSNSPANNSQFESLQRALDQYVQARKLKLENLLENQLGFRESWQIQKRHFFKDLLLNPLNTIWAIPYFSFRKIIESCEKLGWQTGHSLLMRIPQALKTGYQKEIEQILILELFGMAAQNLKTCELRRYFEHQIALKNSLSESDWNEFIRTGEKQIRASVSEFCVRQNTLMDLISSGFVLLVAHFSVGDKSLDIFHLSRKIAQLWAKRDAASHFVFGKKWGQAFYNVAAPPPPTMTQIVITTAIGISILALLSTFAGALSYPLQKTVGLQKMQLESLITSVADKLLIELSKKIKQINSDTSQLINSKPA